MYVLCECMFMLLGNSVLFVPSIIIKLTNEREGFEREGLMGFVVA